MQLVIIAGPDKGRTFPLEPGEPLRVGRSQTTPTRLTDPHVSRVHCEVQFDGKRVTIKDAKSAAGTFVNGQRVSEQTMQPGDIIRIGETELRLEGARDADAETLVPDPALAAKGVKPSGTLGAQPEAVRQLADLAGKPLSHFQLDRVLATGQTGLIFLARDNKDNEVVALKVLKPEISQNEEEMQRFVRSMKTMLPVRHKNLVSIYNAGKTGPYCWIAMEFVEGESLTQVMKRIGYGGRLDWIHAFRVAVHIGRALDYAHSRHIIHRNIMPQNIMIRTSDNLTKLGDLMLAKALEGTMAQQVTRPGELIGDVHYMAPERTREGVKIDGRSDIYGLGATAYALLTGRPPFEGDSLVEVITKIRQEPPEKPKKFQLSIPDMLEGIVLKMLAKRPEERYQHAGDLLVDLEKVAKFQGVSV
jgi:serine/threonine protein kinase